MEEKTEWNLEEVAEKPLSPDIIGQMADEQEDLVDVVLILHQVSPVQAKLIGRMLRTLKVESYSMDVENLIKDGEISD